MKCYIILYIIIYKCVNSLNIKTTFIANPKVGTRDSTIKSHVLTTHVKRRIANQQVYNRDDVTIRLPYYKNPKNRFIKIVEQTSNVEYTPIEKLLEKVKDQNTYKDFAKIKSTFLEIVKWMCFKREEITSHELFPYFRLDVLSNSSMFGAVYSRFLNNLLKSSKVFKSTRLKNGLKHYSFYRDKVSNEYLSLDNYVDVFFPVLMDQKSFFQRVLNLCKNNDKLDVIESIFKDHREPKMSLIRELFSVRCTFIRSHWGYLVSRVTKMNTKSTLELISQICEPKDIKNFDYLKTGEDNLQFAEAHQETIMNLFSHVYKIYRRAKEEVDAKRSLDPLGNLGIVILESRPTEDELAAIYFLCKYHLSNRFEDILCHFIQIVDYINRKIQTKECDYKSMKLFIETVCIIYMKYIVKRCFRFDRRLRLIIKEIVTGREKINMAISSNAREDLANKGLENFLKFLNIECEDPKSEDLIYGIIRDSDSIFIYDFKKERFVCGNNVEEMDLRNFEGKCLDKVNSCHFIIFSNSFDGEKTVKENIEFIEKNYLGKIKPELLQTFITLDLPNFKQNPPQPFDECVLRQDKIVTHPVNPKLYMFSYDWRTK